MQSVKKLIPKRFYVMRALLGTRFWKSLGKRILDGQITDRATIMAFYLLFSFFPMLLMLATVADLLWTPQDFFSVAEPFLHALPSAAQQTVQYFVSDLLSGEGGTALFSVWTLGLLWSTSAYFRAAIENIGRLTVVPRQRAFWSTIWWSIRFAVCAMAVTFVLIVVVFGPFVVEWLAAHIEYFESMALGLWAIVRWPLILATTILSLDYLYYRSPAGPTKWRWVTVGSLGATLLCIIFSLGLGYYAAGFGNYQKVYGTLGGVVLLLLWAWLINIAILLGVVANSAVAETVEALTAEDLAEKSSE